MSTPKIITGYVTALPIHTDDAHARVAVEADGIVYHVVRRGAGVDLDDHPGAPVEVTGLVRQDEDENWLINVRAYTLLEDDSWLEDE